MKPKFDTQQMNRICFLIEHGSTIDEIAIEFKMSTKDFMEIAINNIQH